MSGVALENSKVVGRIRHLKHGVASPVVVPSTAMSKLELTPDAQQSGVRPTVQRARVRKRHWLILLSFLLMVVVPVCATAYYLWTYAADQYASRVAFSVRTEETSSAIELLGGITELSGASSSDTDILFAYLESQDLVAQVDERTNLRAIWSRVTSADDPLFAFDPTGTIEDLHDHWDRKVSTAYDSSTRLIDLRVLAFDPLDAQRIAQAVLNESAAMIDRLSRIAQQDAIGATQVELNKAMERLKAARQSLTRFRNRTQIVDPSIDTQNQMGLLVTLQQQLAEALIASDLLAQTTRQNDPRVSQANRRIEVIEARILSERRNLGLGDETERREVFAALVGEYEGLVVDREFAEAAYAAALAAHDAALAEVRKKSRYLAAHVQPTLAEKAEYPERLTILAVVAVFSMFAWAIFCLVYYSLRDRR